MSANARFVLEFQVTGDNEVVGKIREVGKAGKETAAELESLRGIQNPFDAVAEGAAAGVAPIEELGTAATDTVGPMEELGSAGDTAVKPMEELGSATEGLGGIFDSAGTSTSDFTANMDAIGGSADATAGGLTSANTAVGDFGEGATTAGASTEGLGSSVQSISGTIAGLGGTIGSTVSSFFRYQDAALKVQKAQAAVQRATESYRKAEAGVDAVLKTATSNAAGIAAARQRLGEAQARVNQLMDAGVTSGAEYEAAQAELQAAQAALNAEFVKGGGDAAKLTAAMEKAEGGASKLAIATNNLEKATRNQNMTTLDMVFGFTGMAGTMVQGASSIKAMGTEFKTLAGIMKTLPFAVLGAALVVAAGAVAALLGTTAALSHNFGGLTDSLAGVGKAFGDAIPPMRGFLITLEDAGRSTADFFTRYTEALGNFAGVTSINVDFTKQKFSELVTQYIKTGTTGSAVIDGIVSDLVSWGKAHGMTTDQIIAKAKENDASFDKSGKIVQKSTAEMAKGVQSVIDPTKGLNSILGATAKHLSSVGSTVVKSGGSFIELHGTLTDLGNGFSEVGGHIVKNTDILNKSGLSAEQAANKITIYSSAADDAVDPTASASDEIRILGEDLDESGAKAQTAAHELLALADSAQNMQEAIDQNHLAFAQSVDRVTDLNSVLSDSEAHHEAVQTAVNNTTAALLEESIKLEAAAASAGNAEQQALRLANAYDKGVVSILEFANSLAEAQEQERGEIEALSALGAKWTDIPPHIAKTTEALKTYGLEAKNSQKAAIDAANASADAWRNMTSTVGGVIDELISITQKGGETMSEDMGKAFEGLEAKLGRDLTGAEKATLNKFKDIGVGVQAAITEWEVAQFMGEQLDPSQLAGTFDKMATTVGGSMSQALSKASALIRKHPDLTAAVNDIMREAGKTAPTELIRQLDALLPPGIKNSATKAAAGLPGSLDPAAGQAGNSAAITLSQEFAAAGTHITKVLEGISANIANLGKGPGHGAIVIPVTADVTQAASQLQSIANTARTMQATVIVTADVTQAGQQLNSVMSAAQSLKPIIYVDANIAAAQTKLGALGSPLKPLTVYVDANIAAAQTKISALAGAGNKPVTVYVDANISAAQTKLGALQNQPPITVTYNIVTKGTPPVATPITTTVTYVYVQPTPPAPKPLTGTITYQNVIPSPPKPPNILRNITYKNVVPKPPNPPNINRTITYKNKVPKPPDPPNINRTITYRIKTVGRRPAQHGMHERLASDTLIEAHKGERVDITPGGAEGEARTSGRVAGGGNGGGRSIINLNVIGQIDGQPLLRFMKRNLMDNASGAM